MNWLQPMPVDPYGRFMISAYEENVIIGNPTGFLSFFGRPENGGQTLFSPDSAVIDIDIVRGNEKTAVLVRRGGDGRPIKGRPSTQAQKSTAVSRLYPLIEEEGDISADQLNRRLAGENPYVSMSKLDRLRMLALTQHKEHFRRIIRSFERLAAQSILTGKQVAIFGTVDADLIYDFYRNSENTIPVLTGWNQSGADILGDIDEGCKTMRKNGHTTPDMIILGNQAMDAFIKSETIEAVADNRRFELVEVSADIRIPPKYQRFIAGGFIPRGRIRTSGWELWLFTYVDGYDDDAGDFQQYMPEDQALIASTAARCDRYFGPAETLPMTASRAAWYREVFGFNPEMPLMPPNVRGMSDVINPAMFSCDAYLGPTQKTITIRTQAAPIFAPIMTDGFVTLTGLIT